MSTNGGRAWKALITLLQSQKAWMADQLVEYDLTPLLAHALHMLSAEGELTMSSFAGCMFVDASNATGLIDRLEARGLVERRPSDTDRRAKVVDLTPAGKRLQRRLDDALLRQAPPAIEALSASDQRTLREILERAVAIAESSLPTNDKTA
jgi:DNA-binding MarR family transcriptional regulator